MELTYATPATVNMDAGKLETIECITQKAIEDKITSAMNILVVRHGKIVYHKAIGNLYLRPDSPPVPLDALYSVRSISKPITAALIMILVDRGLLRIDDPVQKYIPEFVGEGKSRVKIRHLLTHTSGMFDEDIYQYCNSYAGQLSIPDTVPSYLKKETRWWLTMLKAPLTKKTGKEMSYCNNGYNLLGLIIQAVTGQTIHAFSKKNLFGPLGMKDTAYVKSPRQTAGRVVERIPREGKTVNWMCSPGCFNHMSGCCSVSTTTYDLAIFGQMLLNGGEYGGVRILGRKSVRLMTTNQIPSVPAVYGAETFTEAAWGLGFNINGVQNNFPTNLAFSHGGYAGSFLLIDPILDLVVVTLKALHFIEEIDFPGVNEAVVDACNDYEALKTPPLS